MDNNESDIKPQTKPAEITFSEQAKHLVEYLKLDPEDVKRWYQIETSIIGGGMIHHYLIAKSAEKINI